MAVNTANYGLIKPGPDDFYDIAVLNENLDAIDGALKNHEGALGNKVDKAAGKGLSANDFTDAYKKKVDDSAAAVGSLGTNKADLVDGKIPSSQLPALDYDALGSAAAVQTNLNSHDADTVKHITAAERTAWNGKAPLASPALAGVPTAPTAAAGTNTTQLATTAFVVREIEEKRTNVIVNLYTVPRAAVKMTLGAESLSATASSSGLAVFNLKNLGTYTARIQTANATYTAQIDAGLVGIHNLALPRFADMAWADIHAVGQGGNAAKTFAIGDEKTITLTTAERITLRIEDFYHDDLVAGGKAPITIGMKNLFTTLYGMNTSNINTGGWSASAMRERMSSVFFDRLPADLQAVIKPVIKKGMAGNYSSAIQTTNDSLWLFSAKEAGVLTTDAGHMDEGETYPLFVDNVSRRKSLSDGAGVMQYWWTRSPINPGITFVVILSTGAYNAGYVPSNPYGVCLGFCI